MRVIKKAETPWVPTTALLLVPDISEEWNLAKTSCPVNAGGFDRWMRHHLRIDLFKGGVY
jgi:hypothetical protein